MDGITLIKHVRNRINEIGLDAMSSRKALGGRLEELSEMLDRAVVELEREKTELRLNM